MRYREKLEKDLSILMIGEEEDKIPAIAEVGFMLCDYADRRFSEMIQGYCEKGEISTDEELDHSLRQTLWTCVNRFIKEYESFEPIMKLIVTYKGGDSEQLLDKYNQVYMLFIDECASRLKEMIFKGEKLEKI